MSLIEMEKYEMNQSVGKNVLFYLILFLKRYNKNLANNTCRIKKTCAKFLRVVFLLMYINHIIGVLWLMNTPEN